MASSLLESDLLQQLQSRSPRSISQYGRNEETMRRTMGAGKSGLSQSTQEYLQRVDKQQKFQFSALTAEKLQGIAIKTTVVASVDSGIESDSGAPPASASDDGRELVSSRRGNRGIAQRESVAYEQGKRRDFETLFETRLNQFQTVDEGQLTYRATYNGALGKPQLGSAVTMLADDDEDGLSDSTIQQAKKKASPVEVAVNLSHGEEADKAADVSEPQSMPHKSPRGGDHPTSSFLSPERFTAVKSGIPPVGHYRPKHTLSEGAVVGGYIAKLLPTKPHGHTPAAPIYKDGINNNSLSLDMSQGQQSLQHMASVLSGVGRADSPKSPTRAGGGAPGSPSKTAAAKTETAVFRSASPKIGPPAKSPAPDEWYWPRNDPKSPRSFSTRGRGDFMQCTPRRPLVDPPSVPDAYYNVIGVTGADSMHTVRAFENQHRPVAVTVQSASMATDGDTNFDANQALKLTRPAAAAVDFSKSTPRKDMAPAFIATTSVDYVESIGDPMKAHVPAFSYDTLLPRKSNLRPMLDLEYDVNDSLAKPRQPAAVIDPNAPGHLPLTRCDVPTEVGEPPRLSFSRPRISREIPFEQYSPRAEAKLRTLDVLYECEGPLKKHVYPRVVGNPMMHDALSREARSKYSTKPTLQAEYTWSVPRLPMAHYEFEKHVPSEEYHTGPISSHKYNLNHPRAPPVGTYFPPDPSYFEVKGTKSKGQKEQRASPQRSSPRTVR